MLLSLDHLQGPLSGYLNDTEKQKLLQDHLDDLFFVTSLNLDPVEPLLNSLYSPVERRPPRDKKAMLRSLLLMIHHQQVSITQWVDLTRKDPFLALLAGFHKDDTPGIGTYYDFIDRLVDGPNLKPCPHIVKPSSLLPKTFLRSLKQESLQKKEDLSPNHPQLVLSSRRGIEISEKLVAHLLANSDQPRPHDSLKLLEDLFIQLAFIPSIQLGLVEPKNLTVSGDGSIIESHASAYPKPVCDCRKKASPAVTVLNPFAPLPLPGAMTPTAIPSSSETAVTPWSPTKTTHTSPCSLCSRVAMSPTSPCL